MTSQTAGPLWPSAVPPPASPALCWELSEVAQLPTVRAELRRHATTAARRDDARSADLLDQLVLALDEMASNALRHGGGGVCAAVGVTDGAYLLQVSDAAVSAPPAPAVGRDPSEGGLGLYLIAELAASHGWYVRDGRKHVWALLVRR